MTSSQPVRPPEWLHDKRCLANAIINAVENLRDTEGFSDLNFRLSVQTNEALEMADEYLRDGMVTCICAAPWPQPECTHEAGMVPDDEAGWWVCELGCGHHTAPGTNTPPEDRLSAGDGSANAYYVDRQLGELGGRS